MREILRIAWDRWQIIARINGDYLARILVNTFYFTVLVPFALGMKLFADPLELRNTPRTQWKARKPVSAALEDARNQF